MGSTRSDLAHLMRRAGFGATPAELDSLESAGWDATVSSLLDFSQPDPAADALAVPQMSFFPADYFTQVGPPSAATQQERRQFVQSQMGAIVPLQQWWLQRMAVTVHPLREKLSLLWHGNFATAINKVQLPLLMYRQNQIFRAMGSGNFETMSQALAKDTAMMIWLDTVTNKSQHPNENFARELMERFTMGIGNYTENDVRDGARGFTGWTFDPNGTFVEHPFQHDDGTKTYLGNTGNLSGEDVVHIATNSQASSTWVTSRLWSYLAYPVPPNDPVVSDLAPAYASDHNIANLVRAIFDHPHFTSDNAKNGLVKQPVEYMVGTFRTLGISFTQNRNALQYLKALGQIPFDPPNVGGWPQNGYWLSSASSLSRWQVASLAAKAGDISSIEQASIADRPDAAAHLLSVDGWTSSTAAALKQVAANPVDMMTIALVSPEYVSN